MSRASILGTTQDLHQIGLSPHPIPSHGALFSFWLVENGMDLVATLLDTVDTVLCSHNPRRTNILKSFPVSDPFSLSSPYSVPFSIPTRLLPYLPRIGGTFLPHPVSLITYWNTPFSPAEPRRTTSISSILFFSTSSTIKYHPNTRNEARRHLVYDNPTCLTLSPDPQRLSMAPTRSSVVIPVCFHLQKNNITAS